MDKISGNQLNKYILLIALFFSYLIPNSSPIGGFQGGFSIIAPDAKSNAIGGINIVSSENVYGAFNNPALLISENISGGASFQNYSLDRYHQSIILNFKIPPQATGSIGYILSGVKDIIGRGYNGGSTEELNWSNKHGFFSFGISPFNKVSIGLKLNIYFQSLIKEVNATGLGIDFGILYKPTQDMLVGFTVKNINGKSNWKINMNDGTIRDYNEYYPIIYSGAINYNYLNQVKIYIQSDYYSELDIGFIGNINKVGIEYKFINYNLPIYFRAGYNSINKTCGFGVPVKKYLNINYALIIGKKNDGNSHVFTWDFNL
jgi:hypothetical protein